MQHLQGLDGELLTVVATIFFNGQQTPTTILLTDKSGADMAGRFDPVKLVAFLRTMVPDLSVVPWQDAKMVVPTTNFNVLARLSDNSYSLAVHDGREWELVDSGGNKARLGERKVEAWAVP